MGPPLDVQTRDKTGTTHTTTSAVDNPSIPQPHMTDRKFAWRDATSNTYHKHLSSNPGNCDLHTRRKCGLLRSTHKPHSYWRIGAPRERMHDFRSSTMAPSGAAPSLPSPQVTT